ncbi:MULTISPECIES: GatB/YqeY domain-containing protein [Clostridium]|uniref:GatB/YqeY domain-containing protein n=1 Tax=Clostridium cadaveris TaxID=1529 RepID=A0A1I2JHG7_9CLOT|nr:GatB/YqeY domain-containing protein [Clostridium cadaveris]MDU4951304.1 GatB/YqeY domain-containing protein [Clostridium sp.]MDM8310747.1 GatB/YqeY domain-containing protein [Clostridium cadaveris]NME63852.1 GatB/YqeY domain-containing protein [Clostridium cadaveris]NWK10459.1 GatB/YqeY domain-containing protein [Clostridium cadaveris]PWL51840.1 MAG: GatB/YqeY domain-containing protein [Clostridium cadaveris]
MPIKERLQEDWKQAMKSKDKFRSSTISLAKSAILLVEKTDGIKLEDEQVIEILAKEVKQRNEAILEFQKGNRQDLVDSAKAEIEILKEYLPQQLSEEEIKKIVIDVADNLGASSMKDMGKVMAEVRPKIVGRADGRLVSSIVKNYLNNK